VIEGQLHTAVVSDRRGVVVGMVTRNVYDGAQRYVVIPQYSWLTGTYDSDVAAGDARLVVQWTSVRFPTGESYALPELRAGDRSGASGLRAAVNNHYGTVFGQAVLSSVIAAAFTGAADDGSAVTRARGEVIAGSAAEQIGRTAAEVTRRNLSIKPTLRVPRLTRFSIILDRDLTFTRPARE
jgi:type IV secretion system protein TrbI